MAELQESIRRAIQDVPEIVTHFQRVLAIYRKSESVKDLCMALYVSILEVLSHILKFMEKKTYKKVFGVMLSRRDYETELMRRISVMKLLHQAVKNEAVLIAQETEKRMAEDVDEISQIIKENYRDIKGIKQLLMIDFTQNSATAENVQQFIDLAKLLFSSPELRKTVTYLPSQGNRGQSATTIRDTVKSQKDIRKALMLPLNYDNQLLDSYLPELLNLAGTLRRADQDRAVWVMQSEVFMDWYWPPSSMSLLVNGQSVAPRDNRSPLTLVAAKLVDSLERLKGVERQSPSSRKRFIGLHFFRGEHEDGSESNHNNTLFTISSLITQMIRQCKHVDLMLLSEMGDFEWHDTSAILERFKTLLKILPKGTTVFCVVDALSSTYADDEREQMADIVMKYLVGLTRVGKRGIAHRCYFKLLLTELMGYDLAGVSKLWEDEILEVPTRLGRGDGFHDMDWELEELVED